MSGRVEEKEWCPLQESTTQQFPRSGKPPLLPCFSPLFHPTLRQAEPPSLQRQTNKTRSPVVPWAVVASQAVHHTHTHTHTHTWSKPLQRPHPPHTHTQTHTSLSMDRVEWIGRRADNEGHCAPATDRGKGKGTTGHHALHIGGQEEEEEPAPHLDLHEVWRLRNGIWRERRQYESRSKDGGSRLRPTCCDKLVCSCSLLFVCLYLYHRSRAHSSWSRSSSGNVWAHCGPMRNASWNKLCDPQKHRTIIKQKKCLGQNWHMYFL